MNNYLALTALGLMSIVPAVAQNHPAKTESHQVKIINPSAGTDSVAEVNVYDIFVDNAPQAFNAPAAPRFALEGKDKKFYLGLGGQVKTTVSYDFGNPIHNGYDFTTANIPMHTAPGNGGLVQFNAAQSGLFVNFVALPGTNDQLGVYINANLTNGTDYGFNLTYAYVKYRGITAGYNYSLFSDMAAAPPSIDYEGPCGFTAIPNGVIDYTYHITPHWSVAAGLEMPITSVTTGDGTTTVSQRVPDVPMYVQYAWGNGNHLRASAIVRNMQYRDIVDAKNRNRAGWGVKLSGVASITPLVTAYGEAAYGRGMTSYFQDLYDGGLDMVPDGPGELNTVKAWGGYLGLQWHLSSKVYATTTYSHVRNYAPYYSGGSTEWGDQYKYAQYALGNVIWQINDVVSTGVEYIYGRRVNHDGSQAHDNRIQAMLQVSF